MKKFSIKKLSEIIVGRRKTTGITQAELAKKSGINRSVLSNIENESHMPSIEQIEKLSEVLDFEIADLFVEQRERETVKGNYNIAVAGTGYVGLSLAVLLAQHNSVTAVDIVREKVDKINNFVSPIKDDYIEAFLSEAKKGKRKLDITATTDGETAYKNADYIIIAAPTNYDSKKNFFDCSAVESIVGTVKRITEGKEKKPTIVIKSTIPVGYTKHIREKFGVDNVIFSPEFLRESKALYDNLYPSRIIVGTDDKNREAAEIFAALLRQGAIKNPVETLFMGYTEAEATKLFVNTYLALRVPRPAAGAPGTSGWRRCSRCGRGHGGCICTDSQSGRRWTGPCSPGCRRRSDGRLPPADALPEP